jgi:hypothetical protein
MPTAIQTAIQNVPGTYSLRRKEEMRRSLDKSRFHVFEGIEGGTYVKRINCSLKAATLLAVDKQCCGPKLG